MTLSCSITRKVAWSVWLLGSLFYAYQYILRVMPNIFLQDVMQRFEIDTAMMGHFSGVYYLGYALIHIPVGIFLDRYGPKKVMTACIVLSVIGLLPLLYAHHWVYPIVGRFMIGMGSSAAILGVFKIIRMSFGMKSFSRMLSLALAVGLMGAIYGGGPLSYMRERLGFVPVVECIAAAGLLLAVLTYWLVPNEQSAAQGNVLSNIKEVFRNRSVIGLCLFAGLMVGPLEGFADVWGTIFLKQVYGMDATVAASLPSVIFIGMCFGAPLLSLIANKIGGLLAAITAAGAFMTLSFILFLTCHLPVAFLTVTFALVGACSAYQVLVMDKVLSCVREQVGGLATAVANMVIMILGYVFHVTIGTIISFAGGTSSSYALMLGIAVVPVGLILGTAGTLFLSWQEKKAASLSRSAEPV